MSQQCKMSAVSVESLKPKWVEFTETKGVLRCLQPQEDPNTRALGMIFLCPRCKGDKKKEHFCIFLFLPAPIAARPHGRFAPDYKNGKLLPLNQQTLHEVDEHGSQRMLIRPQDLKCGWEGYFCNGMVSWRPSLMERIRGM